MKHHKAWFYNKESYEHILNAHSIIMGIVWLDTSKQNNDPTWRARVISCGVVEFEETFKNSDLGKVYVEALIERQINMAREFIFGDIQASH